MRKKCLLLGGAGFIGKNLAMWLMKKDYEVEIYDLYVKQNYSTKELGGLKYYERELFKDEDLESVIKKQDVIIHLVSSVGPENSMVNPGKCYCNDIVKTIEILDIMRNNDKNKMIFISSGGTVYGNVNCDRLVEDMQLFPQNHYGISKMTIEKILHMYNQIYGMKNLVVRVANPYGIGQQSKKGIGAVTVFAEKIINGEIIEIWGDGSIVRDYIYIDDVVNMITEFVDYDSNAFNIAYNIGTGIGTSLNQLITELESQIGKEAIVRYKNYRNIDVQRNVLNMEKTFNAIGNVIQYSLRNGIKRYLELMRS